MTTGTEPAVTTGGAATTGTPTPGVSLGTQSSGGASSQTGVSTGSDPAAGGGAKPWYDGLVKDADNLKTLEAKKWDSAEAVLKSYRELETAFSSKSAGASQAPSDPKGYEFKVPTDVPNYNPAFADAFKQWSHKAGLSKEAAASLHDQFVGFAQESFKTAATQVSEQLTASIVSTKADLEKAWGSDKTPEFARNLEMAKRAANKLDPGLMDALREIGVIKKVGDSEMIANSAVFKALAKVGGSLYAEDSLHGDASSNSNPFSDKTEDRMAQGRLIQSDPSRAALLIRAAGPQAEKRFEHFLSSFR